MNSSVCKACSATNTERVEVRSGLTYIVCKDCGYCEKALNLNEITEAFESAQLRYYGSDTPILHAGYSPFENEILRYHTKIFRRYLWEKSSVIEVGPGAGTFLNWLLENGHSVTAVEHSTELARRLIERFSIPVIMGEFETAFVAEGSADAFCSFHVIEHVMNPAEHISKAFRVVREGGYGFIATPNADSCVHLLARRLSPNYDSGHLRVFSCNSLRHLCEREGWSVLEINTPEYAISWLRVASKILRRIRGEDEEETAGKYAVGGSKAFNLITLLTKVITSPIRFFLTISGLGNELFVVLKK
uniref:Class I SAM-dependent methyltransferase n=1 Tax=Anaerolinea thermolimosa TaxID=229919 RepID=A0A7C4PLU1_9CHLR